MEKTTLGEIRSDIKYKRDSLHLAHEELKSQGDFWNKIIIFISLGSSLFESTKMKMGWEYPSLELIPIFLSSIVAAVSALIKFKRYNEQQEVLVQSCTVLTSTLNKARNSEEVDEDLLREYHDALELLETSLYPDVRKRFLKASQKNLISIISNEDEYFDLIEKAKNGEDISDYRSDPSVENVKALQAEQANTLNNLEVITENNTGDNDTNYIPSESVATSSEPTLPTQSTSTSDEQGSTPAAQGGPATQGPATQGPATQGPAAQGPAAQGPAAQGPATQGTATDTINLEVTDATDPN